MLSTRALTAIVMIPLVVGTILLLPTAAVAMVFAVLCLLALVEWMRLAGIASPLVRSAVVVINALLFALLWELRSTPLANYVIGAGIAGWLLALLWMRSFSWGAAPTRENAVIKMIAGELAILPAWLAVIKLHAEPGNGPWWALFAFVLIWSADSAAYFAGRRFGTSKLAPRISPNKTMAGAWGALLGAFAVSLVSCWLLGLRGIHLAALLCVALVAVIASIAGDLFESLLKRQADVKDSGALFPGHGGLLDRLDSLFAALPVFYAGKLLIDLFISR